MPNTTFVWENLINETLINGNNASEFFCPMEESNVCVKYTYIYNSAGKYKKKVISSIDNRTYGVCKCK